jgi:hypothetical protein
MIAKGHTHGANGILVIANERIRRRVYATGSAASDQRPLGNMLRKRQTQPGCARPSDEVSMCNQRNATWTDITQRLGM